VKDNNNEPNPNSYLEHCSIQIKILNPIKYFLHENSKNKRKRLTSNVGQVVFSLGPKP
jgi:hypothetical protein